MWAGSLSFKPLIMASARRAVGDGVIRRQIGPFLQAHLVGMGFVAIGRGKPGKQVTGHWKQV